MNRLRIPALLLLAGLVVPAWADPPRYETRKEHDPDGIGKFYMGREIAQVMGHQGAGWLERPEREKEEEPAKLLEALKLKEGLVVADICFGMRRRARLGAVLRHVGPDAGERRFRRFALHDGSSPFRACPSSRSSSRRR